MVWRTSQIRRIKRSAMATLYHFCAQCLVIAMRKSLAVQPPQAVIARIRVLTAMTTLFAHIRSGQITVTSPKNGLGKCIFYLGERPIEMYELQMWKF